MGAKKSLELSRLYGVATQDIITAVITLNSTMLVPSVFFTYRMNCQEKGCAH
jgi:hypothetical protein